MLRDTSLNPKTFAIDEVRERIPLLRALLEARGVSVAYLMGSAAEGTADDMSDLDVAVLTPSDVSDWLEFRTAVHADLCEALDADNIDLILLDRAPLSLQLAAATIGTPLVDGAAACGWLEDVLARRADVGTWWKDNWEATRRLVLAGVAEDVDMVSHERIERFVYSVRDAVREINALELEQLGLDGYLAEKQTRALSEHYLRIAMEATLDLCRHVIVATGLGVPQEYRDIGRILGHQGVVTPEVSHKLVAMAGMRNVLVHIYWDVEHERVYRTATNDLDVFEAVVPCVVEYVDSMGSASE
jgi:uncharacterized protein YutE (UPF0331/DUF86 family)/predicted nucleotidyltransferase